MASVIRKLKDADLEAVHHMIRRRAHTQLEIAREIERRLGKKIAKNDAARQRIVSRYANSTVYENWLKRWHNQDVELKKALDAQKRKYELISSLVKGGDQTGFEAIPKALLSRVLVLAAEMSDEELLAASSGKGPVATAMRLTREYMDAERKLLAERAENVAGDSSIDETERRRRIREIFGKDT